MLKAITKNYKFCLILTYNFGLSAKRNLKCVLKKDSGVKFRNTIKRNLSVAPMV